ncbi:prepilin-type N-terminal cleavage/methylation domain-containing protein [Schinkia sp. CFF1]
MRLSSFNKNRGFTLLEVLLSLTLIFIILFPLYGFFLKAYGNTMESKNKTVAVNLARNVVNYMEKQNIFVMREFLDANKGSNNFAVITWENCVADKDCVKPDADGKKDISTCNESTISDFPLFTSGVDDTGNSITDGRICYSVLAPEVNNFDYKDQIKVYVRDYYKDEDETKNQELINILKTEKDSSTLEDKVKGKLSEIVSSSGPNQYESILKVYVVVNWHEKRDNIVLEGVISDEALR